MYYTSIGYFGKEFDRIARQMPTDTSNLSAFLEWKASAKERLEEILKIKKIEMCEAKPELLEEEVIEGNILRQKVVIQVQPEVYMPMYILIPSGCQDNKNAKCMIAMSGHMGGGMVSVAGIREDEKVIAAIEQFNYDYGLSLAKNGIVAICPETRGFGERREALVQGKEWILECSCYHISRIALGLGYTLMGLQVSDVMRLVDYIVERNEWDVENLGILGFSGGGLQALYAAALDERIKNIVISGYMYGYKQALFEKNGNCNCNYADGLWQNFDMGDIGALLSPRKFVVQSGSEDHLNGRDGLKNVYEQIAIIKGAYDVQEEEEKFMHEVYAGGHKWYKEGLERYLEFFEMK